MEAMTTINPLSEMAEVDDRVTLCQYLYEGTAASLFIQLDGVRTAAVQENDSNDSHNCSNILSRSAVQKMDEASSAEMGFPLVSLVPKVLGGIATSSNSVQGVKKSPLKGVRLKSSSVKQQVKPIHHKKLNTSREEKKGTVSNRDFLTRILKQTNKSNERKFDTRRTTESVVVEQVKEKAGIIRKGRLFEKRFQSKSTTIYSSYLQR